MAKIDIIIPAYNAARFVTSAIESVVTQTFTDWKIILVDDGSRDNTAEVVAPYIDRLGDKLEFIKQPNGGVSAARNNGIAHSSAEYIAFLDADDVWLPFRINESLRALQDTPAAGLSYGFISRIDTAGKVIDSWDRPQRHGEGRVAPYIYMRKIDLPTLTVTVRRRCIDEVGTFDETLRITEDRDLWFRIALRYEVALIPRILALYRVSPTSITTDPDLMLRSQLRFIEKHYGAEGCGPIQRQIAMGRVYKQRADQFALRRQRWPALTSSLCALAVCPFDFDNVRTAGSMMLRLAGIRS